MKKYLKQYNEKGNDIFNLVPSEPVIWSVFLQKKFFLECMWYIIKAMKTAIQENLKRK